MQNGICTVASASNSSLFGNVGCAVRELILQKFPQNYFKYTNVSTELAFRNIRRQLGRNQNREFKKRLKPYLIIQPTYQAPDADTFLQDINLTKNDMDIQYGLSAGYLFDCIKDDPNRYGLKFKVNRDRIEYDVTVTVSTLHHQLDIYKAMHNQITWDRGLYLTAALESVIPKSMIQYMACLSNYDIINHPDQISSFVRHLNQVSAYPITYKLRNASATDEYFMYYTHQMVVAFSDLNLDTPSKKNMVDDYYNITFRVTVDFNLPGLYMLDANPERLRELRVDLNVVTPQDSGEDIEEFVPLFTLTNLFNRYPATKDGLTLYGSSIFHPDVKSGDDFVSLKNVLDQSHIQAIRVYNNFGNVPTTIVRLYVIKDGVELTEDQYHVDWSKLELVVHNINRESTYRILLYVNMEKINEVLIQTKDVQASDRSFLRVNDASSLPIVENPPVEEPETPDDPIIPPEEDTPSGEENIMKYSSSIFDSDTKLTVTAQETEEDENPPKKKYASSITEEKKVPALTITESLEELNHSSMEIWTKILSSAVLYNYANSIALENSNNYSVNSTIHATE